MELSYNDIVAFNELLINDASVKYELSSDANLITECSKFASIDQSSNLAQNEIVNSSVPIV